MIAFGVGFGAVALLASFIAGALPVYTSSATSTENMLRAIVLLGVVPTGLGIAVAGAIDALSPRRLFASQSNLARALFGAACAALSICLCTLGIALLGDQIPDPVNASAAPAIVTTLAVVTLRPVRAWHCLRCGYDRHGSERSPNCPECGATVIA